VQFADWHTFMSLINTELCEHDLHVCTSSWLSICMQGWVVQTVPIILSLSKAVLLHRKHASAMTSHNICCDHEDMKKGML